MVEFFSSRPGVAIITGIIHILIHIDGTVFFGLAIKTIQEHDIQVFLTICKLFCIISVLFGISMIAGVYTKRHQLIKPYLELGSFGLLSSGSLWVLLIGAFIWHREDISMIYFLITGGILTEGVQILLLLPAFSLYKEWVAEANGTQTHEKNDPILNNFTNQYAEKKHAAAHEVV